MNRTVKMLLVSELLFVSPLIGAQNPIDCVDTDIANTLLGNPDEGRIQISRQLPRQFPRIAVPEGLALIGSKRTSHYTVVSFKSSLLVEKTRAAVQSMMADAKWKTYKSPFRGNPGGFQSSTVNSLRDAATYCHDEYGHMSAVFSEAPEKAIYVTLMGSMQRSLNQCNMAQDRLMSVFGNTVGKMPRLTLPENATSAPGVGLSSSGGDGASTNIELETTLSSTELLAFFGAQLTAQEWREETHWSGRKVSGSVWTAEDEASSGVLRIVLLGDDRYKLNFQVTQH